MIFGSGYALYICLECWNSPQTYIFMADSSFTITTCAQYKIPFANNCSAFWAINCWSVSLYADYVGIGHAYGFNLSDRCGTIKLDAIILRISVSRSFIFSPCSVPLSKRGTAVYCFWRSRLEGFPIVPNKYFGTFYYWL